MAANIAMTDDVVNLSKGYPAYLEALKPLLSGQPDITIVARDCSLSALVPVKDTTIPTLPGHLLNICRKGKSKEFFLVKDANVVVRPGTMTLVLAPPGHGKTALLKMLSGRKDPTYGSVTFNGKSREAAAASGLRHDKVTQFVDQVDAHLPLLTVRETFQFAVNHGCVIPQEMDQMPPEEREQLQRVYNAKVDTVLKLLGLEECADTIVGNELMRGVSGGQRKRVTLGEVMLNDARALFLDEITNGLDAATAVDIFRSLRQWCDALNASVVSSPLQPTPEMFELFDSIILMREGQIVYSGPRTEVIPYLASLGFRCPPDQDYADFLIEFLSQPRVVLQRQIEREAQESKHPELSRREQNNETAIVVENDTNEPAGSTASSDADNRPASTPASPSPLPDDAPADLEPIRIHAYGGETELAVLGRSSPQPYVPLPGPNPYFSHQAMAQATSHGTPVTTSALVQAFALSHMGRVLADSTQPERVAEQVLKSKAMPSGQWATRQYGSEYVHSFWRHAAFNLKRQAMLTKRNKGLIIPRIFQSIWLGLVLGSLFYDTDKSNFGGRLGLVIFSCTTMAFANFIEIPVNIGSKRVVFKQCDYGMYHSTSFVLSAVATHVPLAVTETFIFSTFIYWMTGFTYTAAGYFTFFGSLFSLNLALSIWFRFLAFSAPKQSIAEVLAGPSTAIFMLFGGFLIVQPEIPPWFIWIYWISPFSWIVRTLALNEFHSDRYDDPLSPTSNQSAGDSYLGVFGIFTNDDYIWIGPLVMLGYYFVLFFACAYVMKTAKHELSRGTRRVDEEDLTTTQRKSAPLLVSAKPDLSGAYTQAMTLPCPRVTLAFKNIRFTVNLNDKNPDQEKMLLHGVSGFAKPGTLTALMGASGAGKTTLLDVLAGRKTQGRIEGEILLNGIPTTPKAFGRLAAYVEQQDSHMPMATVFESLMFSAKLRLPPSVTDEQRLAMVNNVLELLELDNIRNRLIGDPETLGLSPGQLKRVTIGVELVSNPSVLFLDEPTTGLDSRAALTVLRVIRKIASTGRSVVCTIHQPSAELFYMFDRLLLLQAGGFQVYFGDNGYRGQKLVGYLSNLPESAGGPRTKPARMNPASWMLEVIGAGTGSRGENKVSTDDGKEVAVTISPSSAQMPAVHNHSRHKRDPFADHYHSSPLGKENYAELEQLCSPDTYRSKLAQGSDDVDVVKKQVSAEGESKVTASAYAQSLTRQWLEVQKRAFQMYWRDIPYNFTRFFALLFMGCVIGLLYFQIDDDDQGGVQSKVGMMFMGICNAGVLNCAPALHALIRNRVVFYRERFSNTYNPLAYSISIGLVEIPYIIFVSFLFVIPLYFLSGLDSAPEYFFRYMLGHAAVSICFNSLGQLLTAVMPNQLTAGIMQGQIFSFVFLFGGVYTPGPMIPDGWIWVYHANPVHHGLEAVVNTQFNCGSNCPNITVVGAGQAVMTNREYVSSYYGLEFGDYWVALGYLLLYYSVVRILIALAIQKIAHIKR